MFSKLEESEQHSKEAGIPASILIFLFLLLSFSSELLFFFPKLDLPGVITISNKTEKESNSIVNLLCSVTAGILLLQCYFIIRFLVFFIEAFFFLIWLVTFFYGARKFPYLVNNPHHTTFNEDKGVLHT